MVPKTLVNSPIQVSFTYQIISHKCFPTFDFLGKHTKLFLHGNTTETLAGSPCWNRNTCVCVGGVLLANPHTQTVPVPVIEFKRVWALVSTLSGRGEACLPSTDGVSRGCWCFCCDENHTLRLWWWISQVLLNMAIQFFSYFLVKIILSLNKIFSISWRRYFCFQIKLVKLM